ncbi:mechanosensitive ion channel family protein [Robertkochia aurantiaca]|uniref:mechanosensitive ion channel family protein n=1 Tax=Robertkochia aurantiaca TaxID=2873700 RepID=UPI001CCD4F52|nr:mechanosensitive ion channel family protein [Robertkochia sp. 3YJGBD-33]
MATMIKLSGCKFFLYLMLFSGLFEVSASQQLTVAASPSESGLQTADSVSNSGYPVRFLSDTLFYIYTTLDSVSPQTRAKQVSDKLYVISRFDRFRSDHFRLDCEDLYCQIFYKNIPVTTITKDDGNMLSKSYGALASEYFDRIKSTVKPKREVGFAPFMKRLGLALLSLLGLVVLIFFSNRALNKLIEWLLAKYNYRFPDVEYSGYRFFTRKKIRTLIRLILRALKYVLLFVLIYVFSLVLFSLFPRTKPLADALVEYIVTPLKRFIIAIVNYIPELITVVIVFFLARALVRFLKFLSQEVERGRLQIPGFYTEWAAPTYRLLGILIYIFAFVLVFPYLPGSDSPAFQGVSVFLGLLISLGSTSAISNIIAGLVIIYMRAFKPGDRVKIGEITGDVVEKSMLITRLRTIRNEEVTIPNSAILNGSTINYSSSATELGLILNTTVTIGYDVPWRKVHELLIGAALKTEKIRKEPSPFVLQTSLNDFFVSYQVNLYTEHPENTAVIHSDLHANIQDAFNEAGIEILSPHYRANRDGSESTLPGKATKKKNTS